LMIDQPGTFAIAGSASEIRMLRFSLCMSTSSWAIASGFSSTQSKTSLFRCCSLYDLIINAVSASNAARSNSGFSVVNTAGISRQTGGVSSEASARPASTHWRNTWSTPCQLPGLFLTKVWIAVSSTMSWVARAISSRWAAMSPMLAKRSVSNRRNSLILPSSRLASPLAPASVISAFSLSSLGMSWANDLTLWGRTSSLATIS
jgi:hypothetical protein